MIICAMLGARERYDDFNSSEPRDSHRHLVHMLETLNFLHRHCGMSFGIESDDLQGLFVDVLIDGKRFTSTFMTGNVAARGSWTLSS